MSENKKQTLFRFKTLRAPELLSNDSKEKYYITHPDGTSGPFFAAIAALGGSPGKRTALANAAASFTGKKTKTEIQNLNSGLANFGLFLAKNKSEITIAQIATNITGLSPLISAKYLELWDCLFYQTITLDKGYCRETILEMILAHHFVTNYATMTLTDVSLRAWANSRVTLPTVLFELENKYSTHSTANDLATGKDILQLGIEAAEAKMKTEMLIKAANEVKNYKANFLKVNNKLEATAIQTHLAAVNTAQNAATKVDYVDQFTQFTFQKFTNYTAPVFSYQRPAEIDSTAMGQVFSEESHYLLQNDNYYATKSFDELINSLNAAVSNLSKEMFDRTSFQNEKLAIDGTLISKCGIDRRYSKRYAFLIKLVKKANNKYGAVMTLDLGTDCLKLDTAIFNFKDPINAAFTTQKAVNAKGILTIDLLPNQSIELTSENGLDVSGELIFANGLRLSFARDFVAINGFLYGVMTRNTNDGDTSDIFIPSGFGVTRLGIADYRKVEQTLCCYLPGEVSHIENVMAREYKERSTKRLRRTDSKVSSSSSSEVENMTDTTTTTRFDIQKEISTVLSDSMDSSIGVNSHNGSSGKIPGAGDVTFNIGFDVSTDFALSSSSEESNSMSTNFAKDVTEKALQRLVSKVSEERTLQIIEEFEEKNQHGFDNRLGAEHISGVYRWVDKIYKNEIHNYGKRLQYEFMLPEPSAFHLIAKAGLAISENEIPLIKPLDPRKEMFGVLSPLRNAAHVLPSNYHQWAAAYGAEVTPPPNEYLTVGKTLLRPDDGSEWHLSKTVKEEIIVPNGYGVQAIYFSQGCQKKEPWSHIVVSAAGVTKRVYEDIVDQWFFADSVSHNTLRDYTSVIPVSAQFTGVQGGMVSFSVRLDRKHSLLEDWQLRTFTAILSAYEDRLQEYKGAIAELEIKKAARMGDNPGYYRTIENTVLKKNCISYLIGHNNLGKAFTTGTEIHNNQVVLSRQMDEYSAKVKFLEQAFEWDLMDYKFYPFYWANREKWDELYAIENDDILFRSFLRSGMARAMLSVRPGFEEAVMFFMATGSIWNGGKVPVIGDDLYLSILDELKEPDYYLEESWETRVPSNLTVIQAKTIGLNAEGLPCYCDELEPPTETIASPLVSPLAELTVHVEGYTSPAV